MGDSAVVEVAGEVTMEESSTTQSVTKTVHESEGFRLVGARLLSESGKVESSVTLPTHTLPSSKPSSSSASQSVTHYTTPDGGEHSVTTFETTHVQSSHESSVHVETLLEGSHVEGSVATESVVAESSAAITDIPNEDTQPEKEAPITESELQQQAEEPATQPVPESQPVDENANAIPEEQEVQQPPEPASELAQDSVEEQVAEPRVEEQVTESVAETEKKSEEPAAAAEISQENIKSQLQDIISEIEEEVMHEEVQNGDEGEPISAEEEKPVVAEEEDKEKEAPIQGNEPKEEEGGAGGEAVDEVVESTESKAVLEGCVGVEEGKQVMEEGEEEQERIEYYDEEGVLHHTWRPKGKYDVQKTEVTYEDVVPIRIPEVALKEPEIKPQPQQPQQLPQEPEPALQPREAQAPIANGGMSPQAMSPLDIPEGIPLLARILPKLEPESDGEKKISLERLFTPATDSGDLTPKKSAQRKMYSSSAFYRPDHPTIDDQVELAQRISFSLVDDNNKMSRGQSMYLKRKNRSMRWVHQGGEGEEMFAGSGIGGDFVDEDGQRPLEKPPLKLLMNPKGVQDFQAVQEHYENLMNAAPTSPDVGKVVQSPVLAASPSGKGAELFAKRKKRMDKFIVDETTVQKAQQQTTSVQQSSSISSSFSSSSKSVSSSSSFSSVKQAEMVRSQQQDQIMEQFLKDRNSGLTLVKSPWQAALETGYTDAAFEDNRVKQQLADSVRSRASSKSAAGASALEMPQPVPSMGGAPTAPAAPASGPFNLPDLTQILTQPPKSESSKCKSEPSKFNRVASKAKVVAPKTRVWQPGDIALGTQHPQRLESVSAREPFSAATADGSSQMPVQCTLTQHFSPSTFSHHSYTDTFDAKALCCETDCSSLIIPCCSAEDSSCSAKMSLTAALPPAFSFLSPEEPEHGTCIHTAVTNPPGNKAETSLINEDPAGSTLTNTPRSAATYLPFVSPDPAANGVSSGPHNNSSLTFNDSTNATLLEGSSAAGSTSFDSTHTPASFTDQFTTAAPSASASFFTPNHSQTHLILSSSLDTLHVLGSHSPVSFVDKSTFVVEENPIQAKNAEQNSAICVVKSIPNAKDLDGLEASPVEQSVKLSSDVILPLGTVCPPVSMIGSPDSLSLCSPSEMLKDITADADTESQHNLSIASSSKESFDMQMANIPTDDFVEAASLKCNVSLMNDETELQNIDLSIPQILVDRTQRPSIDEAELRKYLSELEKTFNPNELASINVDDLRPPDYYRSVSRSSLNEEVGDEIPLFCEKRHFHSSTTDDHELTTINLLCSQERSRKVDVQEEIDECLDLKHNKANSSSHCKDSGEDQHQFPLIPSHGNVKNVHQEEKTDQHCDFISSERFAMKEHDVSIKPESNSSESNTVSALFLSSKSTNPPTPPTGTGAIYTAEVKVVQRASLPPTPVDVPQHSLLDLVDQESNLNKRRSVNFNLAAKGFGTYNDFYKPVTFAT